MLAGVLADRFEENHCHCCCIVPATDGTTNAAGGTFTASTTAVVLSASKAEAKDASEIARIAKAITVRIEGATQGSGVLVKKEGNRYTVLTAWHVVKDNLPGEEVGIITSDSKEHSWEAKSLKRLGEVDMAVLTFTSRNKY